MSERNAFIFTTDALLAVVLSSFLLIAIFSTLGRLGPSKGSERALSALLGDVLVVAEKADILPYEVAGNRTQEMRTLLNALPANVCAEVRVYERGALLLQASRIGCYCTGDITAARRSFIAHNAWGTQAEYIAVISGCYR